MSLKKSFALTDEHERIVEGLENIVRNQRLAREPQEPELQALLWWAVDFGSDEQLKKALAAGASANMRTPRGETLLGNTITRGFPPGRNQLERVRLLLAAGADPNITSERDLPIQLAARYQRTDLLDILWEATNKRKLSREQWTDFLLDVCAGASVDFVRRAVMAGASPNGFGNTRSSASPGCPVTPIMVASFFGYVPVVEALLEAGADVKLKDAQGHTVLDYARVDAKRCRKVIELLEKAGATQAKPFRNPRHATRGFAAAAKKPEFKQARQRMVELAGTKARSLEGPDDTIQGGCGFLVPEERAKALVEAHHSEFLEKGFYLFFTKDLIEENGSAVALLPTDDVYRILAVVETEGANCGVFNEDLIAWLRKLEKKQPFRITGIGSDFVEGRFALPITDSAALVKQINKLCPDGEAGAEMERQQVELLQQTGRLFLWWD